MTSIRLYDLCTAEEQVRLSPHCWKTRLALAHKGLDHSLIPWRFSDRLSKESVSVPAVPVLTHGNRVVSDSWKIAEFLEEQYPDCPTLFGGSGTRELAQFVNTWADTKVAPAVGRLVVLDVYNIIDPRDQDYFRQSREKRFGARLEDVVRDQAMRLQEFRDALVPLRQILRIRPFIAGDAPSYADYCVFGMFVWAHVASDVELLDSTDIEIQAWREKLFNAFGGLARNSPLPTHRYRSATPA